MSETFAFNEICYEKAQSLIPLSIYCSDIRNIQISRLNDKKPFRSAKKEKGSVFYTGGGLVPKSLLDLPELKFLHIHLGKLPDFGGSDCVLWLWSIVKKPSATLIFLAEGIDSGDVITSYDFPIEPIPFTFGRSDLKMVYRVLYAFYVLRLRAVALRQGLLQTCVFNRIEAQSQNGSTIVYRFMSSSLQQN